MTDSDELLAMAIGTILAIAGFAVGWIVFGVPRRFGRVSGVSSVEFIVRFTTGTTTPSPSKALSGVQKTLDAGLQKDGFAMPLPREDGGSGIFAYEILSAAVDRT